MPVRYLSEGRAAMDRVDVFCVYLLVVKGNLRHRILKLGCEKAWCELSPAQRYLRRIAVDQKFVFSKGPERPEWANGAFLYLEPEHAKVIEKYIADSGLKLQSKHMLVSASILQLTEQTLKEGPECSGREAFLMRRAGSIEKKEQLPLLTDGIVVQIRGTADSEARNAWQSLQEQDGAKADGPSWANGACVFYLKPEHIDYAKDAVEFHNIHLDDRDALVSLERRPSFEQALRLPGREVSAEVFLFERSKVIKSEIDFQDFIGLPQNNFLLISLGIHLCEEKNIDLDLAEFLTSPLSVQVQDKEMWRDAWRHVCKENAWLEMREAGRSRFNQPSMRLSTWTVSRLCG